jgi:hypothetical protein
VPSGTETFHRNNQPLAWLANFQRAFGTAAARSQTHVTKYFHPPPSLQPLRLVLRTQSRSVRKLHSLGPGFAFMDAQLVAVGIENDGRPAAGQIEGVVGEGNVMTAQVRDGFVEIGHFQHQLRAVARRFEERLVPDGQGMRADFVFDQESLRNLAPRAPSRFNWRVTDSEYRFRAASPGRIFGAQPSSYGPRTPRCWRPRSYRLTNRSTRSDPARTGYGKRGQVQW